MAELMLMKTPTGALVPADAAAAEFIQKLKTGQGLKGEFKRQRNPRFHRKVFSLFKFAFDLWDAPELEYKGQKVAKNLDQFRKDLTILAGYYNAHVNLKGEVRVTAKSLSFANMGEDEFGEVFKSLLEVVWRHVLCAKGYDSPERVEAIVEELLRYEQ